MSALFILVFGAFTMNITAQTLYIEKKDASVKEFNVSDIDYISFPVVLPEFVRVDADPADGNWTGKYLIVYEAQAGTGNNTYQSKTVLTFNGGIAGAPVDAAGNIIVLSPNTPGTPEDLALLTGGTVTKTATEVTVSGGQIKWSADLQAAVVTIAPVEGGGWSIQTGGGYYLGGGGGTGSLSANETFAANHVHAISIGDANSDVTPTVTLHGCAIIKSSTVGANNTMRVNANTGRFGYWPAANMSPVALYKLKTEEVEPFFSVDQTPKSVGWEGNSTAEISVIGNVAWTASVVGEGASITSGDSGTGAGTVTVSFSENTSTSPRPATVTISTDDAGITTQKSFDVTITQNGFVDSGTKYFVKVNADPADGDWEGEYLIVHEASSVAFNSALNPSGTAAGTLDGTGNIANVTINSGNKIEANDATDAIKVTIEKVEGGWSVLTASGYYIGNAGTTNIITPATIFAPSNHTNTITISGGNAVISTVGNTGRAMRYNPGDASKRFCFFAANQQDPVALYKLEE